MSMTGYTACLIILATAAFASRKDIAAPTSLGVQLPYLEDLAEPSEAELVAEEIQTIDPLLIPLRRESVPVLRKDSSGTDKVVSFKTSYSGIISIGQPAQAFRVIFDTGSGHLILPSSECDSESCLVHRRYNQTASTTGVPINVNGKMVRPGKKADGATIGFGTGTVKGQFIRDVLCLGGSAHAEQNQANYSATDANVTNVTTAEPLCVKIQGVMARQMSTIPFKHFGFDGILGMGLAALALRPDFSFFDILTRSGQMSHEHFGVFLTDGEDGEESEIAMGGHNSARLSSPVSWTDVINPELGYWLVQIVALRVGGKTLDVCQDGTCRGVVDTGTSHLGLPTPYDEEVMDMLTTAAGDMLDCRLADLPELEIELPGINITLNPDTYMRRLPLREDVDVNHRGAITERTSSDMVADLTTTVTTTFWAATEGKVPRICRPRLMPVNMPAPLGPKFFILGEPVLHRYYTVFDWSGPRIGMGLSTTKRNLRDRTQITDRIGALPEDVDVYLMQKTMHRNSVEMKRRRTVKTDMTSVGGQDSHVVLQVVMMIERVVAVDY